MRKKRKYTKKGLNKGTKKKHTVEEFKKKIDDYFDDCVKNNIPLTITGLALACDFTSREALLNYEKAVGYESYFSTIKKAKLIVQNYAEKYLFTGKNMAGAIFNLKNNYGWNDRQEIEHSGEVTHRFSNLSDDELEKLRKKYLPQK